MALIGEIDDTIIALGGKIDLSSLPVVDC